MTSDQLRDADREIQDTPDDREAVRLIAAALGRKEPGPEHDAETLDAYWGVMASQLYVMPIDDFLAFQLKLDGHRRALELYDNVVAFRFDPAVTGQTEVWRPDGD